MTHRGRDIQQEFYHYKPHTSVLQLLYERMAKIGSKIALVEPWTGYKQTFDEVLENSTSFTGELQSRGVTEGDNILLCCDKSILAYSVLLGIMFTGATAIVIHSQDADKIHLYVENQPVKAVFCDPIYMITVRDSVSQMSTPPHFLANIELGDPFFLLALEFQKKYDVFNVKDVKKHIPLVLFTSGSSGEPKGVQISDLFLQRLGYSFEDEYLYSYLLMGSFSWISSPISLISSIFKRYALILSNSNDPGYNLDLIQKYKVNGMTLNASRLAHYAKEPLLHTRNLSSLVTVVIGGEVVLKRQALMFIDNVLKKRSGIQCLYGLTETGIITTWRYNDLTDYRKINSTGCVAPGVVIKILDDKGRTMPRMCEGEVWVKSVAMMSGYWNKPPEVTSELYNKNGFFRTGDAGYFDYDGFLYIKGRIKDMVDFRGTKMWVSDIEDILKCHPAVIEAAVIPKPDINNSYRLTAFVVKKPYFQVTGEEIASFVGEQVDEDRQLRGGVHFIHELPRNSSSKVNRKRLQEMLE